MNICTFFRLRLIWNCYSMFIKERLLKICKEITKEKEYVNILEFKNSIFITPTNLLC